MLKQQPLATISITISAQTLDAALRSVHACESCSKNACIPFARLLDRLIGQFGATAEYLVEDTACPSCANTIDTDTLVELQSRVSARAKAALTAN